MTTKSMTLTVSLCLATWGAQAATLGLSVSKIGTGTGTVASADRTISCGSKCAATYGSGATVTLTATPATGSSFAGWTGAVTGAGTTVTVKISSATNVAAIFSAGSTATPAYNMALTLSDGAQGTTLAFDGLAMIAGNLQAQSFFPPGKVSDYFGFQYLRDNDPDNMGHDTSFLTRVANNVIYILTRAGPANTTNILITSVYIDAFSNLHFDWAAVQSVVTFLILSMVSVVYARFYFRQENS